MERTTIKEYTIRTATEEESDSIITLLKEVAQWLQHKEVDQWQYLLGG
ncbi:TPA: GNAT family N-acetyltransferase, partial [Bacillus tropicus]